MSIQAVKRRIIGHLVLQDNDTTVHAPCLFIGIGHAPVSHRLHRLPRARSAPAIPIFAAVILAQVTRIRSRKILHLLKQSRINRKDNLINGQAVTLGAAAGTHPQAQHNQEAEPKAHENILISNIMTAFYQEMEMPTKTFTLMPF